MTVIGALSSFRKRRQMSAHKRYALQRIGHRTTLFARGMEASHGEKQT
jgi:hypothetical protein